MNTQQQAVNAQHQPISAQQQAINEGQRDINGALCYVDWQVLEALEALIETLKNRNVLSQADLEEVNEAFQKAYYASPKVAEIDPPGCNPNFWGAMRNAVEPGH